MALDRLSNLVSGLRVGTVMPGPVTGLAFWISRDGAGVRLGLGADCPDDVIVAASLDWAGGGEALVVFGPYALTLAPGTPVAGLAQLLTDEVAQPRCGAVPLLSGYVEVLLVHVLREAVAGRQGQVGLMAGLADQRLARALVAMHDAPGKGWTVDALAEAAGMSRSAFMARFRGVMGQSPMAYLRNWRLARAEEDLARGARVADAARRYGYGNAEAFTRAFSAYHGISPAERRRQSIAPLAAISSAQD